MARSSQICLFPMPQYRLLSMLMNKGELSQIGDNDSGRLFYFAFNEDKPLNMEWLIKLIENLYKDSKDNV